MPGSSVWPAPRWAPAPASAGTFIQPKITCPGVKNQWTSNWVGLDGFMSNTVEQDGTFARCGGAASKTPVYGAFYELFPARAVVVFARAVQQHRHQLLPGRAGRLSRHDEAAVHFC